jgi:hypothetical protein
VKPKPNWPLFWLACATFGGIAGALTVAIIEWSKV